MDVAQNTEQSKTTNSATGTSSDNQSSCTPNHPGFDLIYHNMNASSDFFTFRANADTSVTLEAALQEVARHIEAGCYKIISISGSKYSLVVVMTTELSKAVLQEKGFPFRIPAA